MNSFPFSSRPELRLFLAGSVLFHLLLILLLWKLPAIMLPASGRQNKDLELTLLNDNADNKETPSAKKKYLSMEQSRAHGQITKEKGMNMVMPPPGASGNVKSEAVQQQSKVDIENGGEITIPEKVQPQKKMEAGNGQAGMRIPQDYEFNRAQALNIDSTGEVSFDTEKYQNTVYFRKMTDKIAEKWYPAIPGTAHRWGMIPSGEVEILFALNRKGEVLDYRIVKDYNYSSMTKAAEYAVTHAGPFDPLPDTVKDDVVIIPFIFKYINLQNR
jgi:outer membrane biosynthesis protein TonB